MAAISKETMFAADRDFDQEPFARSRGGRGIITLQDLQGSWHPLLEEQLS